MHGSAQMPLLSRGDLLRDQLGEPEAGQAAVAHQVVLNRVRSGIFPTNVCAVVYQDRNHPFACQFSFACEGKSLRVEEPAAWATATRVAQSVVSGATYNPLLGEALNYHAYYVYPFWAPSLRRVDRIGAHIFYAMRTDLNWAPGQASMRARRSAPAWAARRISRPASRRRRCCPRRPPPPARRAGRRRPSASAFGVDDLEVRQTPALRAHV